MSLSSDGVLHRLPDIFPRQINQETEKFLPLLASHFIRHEFDILGSGWVKNQYGMSAHGFGAYCYGPGETITPDKDGDWIERQINAANVRESRRIWRLIDRDDGYIPIDWQRDIKSGFRWSAKQHFSTAPISPALGADIKVPWELGRLQHLPLLALAARHVEPDMARTCVQEIYAQLLDFIALNPPRFGVQWRCPMDVGIRVANIVLTLDLLDEMQVTRNDAVDGVIKRSIREHAAHIIRYLEWSEEARSNHYLANITGLLFAASVLPRSRQCDAWLAFAVQELGVEIMRQFRDDGGNFEASTGYHALSTEMAITGVSLVQNLNGDKTAALQDYAHRAITVRPAFLPGPMIQHDRPDGGVSFFGENITGRIKRMTAFVTDITRPDGHIVQIGDMDSGRLFKTQSTWRQTPEQTLIENILDRRDVAASGAALATPLSPVENQSAGNLDNFIAAHTSLPPGQRREWIISIPSGTADRLTRASYEQFGLYIFRSDNFYLSIRCFDGRIAGEWGHSHDDNLAIELHIDGRDIITDPGSFVYSPDPQARILYSSCASHFAPRPVHRAASTIENGLFSRRHHAHAERLYMGPSGFVGQLQGADWHATRLIIFERETLRILDSCEPFELDSMDLSSLTHRVTEGYGNKTDRPICSL